MTNNHTQCYPTALMPHAGSLITADCRSCGHAVILHSQTRACAGCEAVWIALDARFADNVAEPSNGNQLPANVTVNVTAEPIDAAKLARQIAGFMETAKRAW